MLAGERTDAVDMSAELRKKRAELAQKEERDVDVCSAARAKRPGPAADSAASTER